MIDFGPSELNIDESLLSEKLTDYIQSRGKRETFKTWKSESIEKIPK